MIDLEKLKEDIQNLPKSVDDLAKPYIDQFKEDYGVSDNIDNIEQFNEALEAFYNSSANILKETATDDNIVRQYRRASALDEMNSEIMEFENFRTNLPNFEEEFNSQQISFKDEYTQLITNELNSINTRLNDAIALHTLLDQNGISSLTEYYEQLESLANNIRTNEKEKNRLLTLLSEDTTIDRKYQSRIRVSINELDSKITADKIKLDFLNRLIPNHTSQDLQKNLNKAEHDFLNLDSLEKEYDLLLNLNKTIQGLDSNPNYDALLDYINDYEGINQKPKQSSDNPNSKDNHDDGKGKDVPSDDDKGKNDTFDALKTHVEEATKKLSDAQEEFNKKFKLSSLNTQDLTNFENKHFEDIDKFTALCNNLLSNIDNPEIAKKNSGYNKFIADYNELMSEVTNAKQVALNKEQAGKTPPMPKEEDDPNPDNYKDTPKYNLLMEVIKVFRENIDKATEFFSDNFEDLNNVSADDLNTFESLYLKQINEDNISDCETFLKDINNPELYEESGFNELKKEADELNKCFKEAKESVQAREQAGKTPPPVENEDKDDENLEDVYFNLTDQIMDKVRNGICLQYGIDETNSLSSNTSTSDLEKFFGSLNIYASLKPTNFKNIYDYLPYFYIDPSNIDNYISDCHTILGKLDEVIQNLEIQKQQEEAGNGGKDDDDPKPGSGSNIYNQILNKLAALEELISNTENNIDYYDSTPKNSQTLLSLQSEYNNIDQTLFNNKTTIPEHLYNSLRSRLNNCHGRIDDIQRNIDNPPPKPVESKKEKITDISYQDPSIIDETSNYVVTLKDGTQLDLEKFKEIVSGVVELIVYGPKTYNYIDTLKSLKFNISEKTLSYDEFYNYITNVITMLPTFPKELNSEKDLYIVEKIEDIKDLFFNHIDRHTESFGYMNLNAIYSQLRRLEQRISYNPPISLDELHNINIEKKQLIEKANNILQKTENKYLKMGKAKRTDISNTITRLEQIYTEIQEAIEKAKIERKEAKKELKKDKNQRLDYKELSKAYKKMLKAEKKGDTSELDFFNECLNQAKSYDKNTKNLLFTDIYNKMQASINVLNRIEANPSLFEKEIKAKKENGIVKKAKQFATSVKNAFGNIKALSSGKDNDDDYIDVPYEDVEEFDVEGATFDAGSNPDNSYDSFRHQQAENAEAARAEAGKPHAEPSPIDVHAEPVTGDDVENPGGSGDHR